MSWGDSVPAFLLFSNTADYATANTSTASAQQLDAPSAGGVYVVPMLMPDMFQPLGRVGPVISGKARGIVTGSAGGISATWTMGISTSPASITFGTTLLTSAAYVIGAGANLGWCLDF